MQADAEVDDRSTCSILQMLAFIVDGPPQDFGVRAVDALVASNTGGTLRALACLVGSNLQAFEVLVSLALRSVAALRGSLEAMTLAADNPRGILEVARAKKSSRFEME